MKTLLSHSLFSLIIMTCNAQTDLKQLDGTISPEESNQLIVIGENDGNQMMIDNSNRDYLRVAIKSTELYVASLCICNTKNEVTVLHASAALGPIVYKKEANNWTTNQKFDWKMRDEGMDAATIAKRKNYLKTYGWVANTMGMGNTGETEFIIDRNTFNGELKLAIGLMTAADPKNIVGIPSNGAGDCADLKLVSGDPKSSYVFDPINWIQVE